MKESHYKQTLHGKLGKGNAFLGLKPAILWGCQGEPESRERGGLGTISPQVPAGVPGWIQNACRGPASALSPPSSSSVERGSFHLTFLLQRTPVRTSLQSTCQTGRPCEHEVSANHSFLRELALDGPQRAGLPTEGVDGVAGAPCGQDEEPPGPGLA